MKTIADRSIKHVEHLAVQIGCRPIGSVANRVAEDYIYKVFERCGLAVEKQEIPCPQWTSEQTLLELNGIPLEASANTFSPACDISGATISICTPAELELASITGKILVLYGDMSQTELATKGGIYISERDRRIIQILEERQPASIITINPTLHACWRLIEDFNLEIPSATVSARSGLHILKNPDAILKMKIGARRSPSQTANVVGTLEGKIPERIVLCAHYDTKVDTPGAYDNAAGMGVLLSLAEHLPQQNLRHTLEWVAFTGEEGAGLGDMEYARKTGNGFDRMTAAINFDGVGPFTGTTTVTSFAASPELETQIDEKINDYPGVLKVEPWPASDHYIFYSNGVPSIAFTSRGIRDVYHTPSDSFEWISSEKLEEAAQFGLGLIEVLDRKGLSWSRPKN